MSKYKIKKIPEFIRFIADLFDDEFDYCIDNVGSLYYFSHGGCFELAKIVKHYFPDTKYALKNDYDHIAILQDGKLFDIFDGYSTEELKSMNIPETMYKKNICDFIIDDALKEINKSSYGTGKNIEINGKSVSEGMVDEIDNIDSIKVGL